MPSDSIKENLLWTFSVQASDHRKLHSTEPLPKAASQLIRYYKREFYPAISIGFSAKYNLSMKAL